MIGHNTDATGFARAVTGLVTASSHGAVAVIGGVGKAIHQAADCFELFAGYVPSIAELGMAFDGVMAKRYSAA